MHCSMSCNSCRLRALILCCGALLSAGATRAAQEKGADSRAAGSISSQAIYVVFPFQNMGASPRLDWLGEGLEELTIQYLSAAGQQVYSHAGRAAELERNGLPVSARLSRASMLRIAQDLDADFVIFGSFTSDGKSLTVESRVLRIDPLGLLPVVHESGPLDSLMELHGKVVWRLLTGNDHPYRFTLAEFSKAQRPLRLDAFEHYIRGLQANEDEAKLRELREASRLEPAWPDPYFALAETYLTRNDCNNALPLLAHVPRTHERYVEAVFSTGACRLQMNQPDRAEEVFTSLQNTLGGSVKGERSGVSGGDLPEILNNLAIARAEQGKFSVAETDLKRATDLDPDEDDYPFNLGLLALHADGFAAAAEYFREAAERRPENPEDRALLILTLEKAGKNPEADQERETATEAFGPKGLPVVYLEPKSDVLQRLERIKTELDATVLRLEIVSPEPRTDSAGDSGAVDSTAAHVRRGRQELTAGHIDVAETEFRSVLRAEPANAAAHRGLADIAHRRGKLDDTVKELQASLQSRDSAVTRTILARIYLEQKKTDLARAEVQRALQLAPNYSEAKQLLEHLQKPNGGAP
jgi:tetratricopeptide (TPR) repeat protein/TolB-like protein